MTILTYPDNLRSRKLPWMLFTAHRPHYKNKQIEIHDTDDNVALYLPIGFTVSDSLQYETHSAGALGTVLNAWQEGAPMTQEEITRRATAIAGSAVRDAALGSTAATVAPGVTGLTSIVEQRTKNQHEFMTFKSPALRSFSLSFKFIPKNEGEASVVPKIIKYFRKHAYPAKAEGGYDYIFPDTFTITVGETSTIIKMSEVACTAISTVYNPNSLSYFVYQNMPSEIDLALTFQELLPIDRSMIERGF